MPVSHREMSQRIRVIDLVDLVTVVQVHLGMVLLTTLANGGLTCLSLLLIFLAYSLGS